MKTKSFTFAAVAALTVLASPAMAASVVFDLSNAGTASGSSARTYTASSNGTTVGLRASAWSLIGKTVLTPAKIGNFSSGLGVINSAENGSSPGHTIDNEGSFDFVLLQFDQAVEIDTGKLTPFTGDNDASVSFANVLSPTTLSTLDLYTSPAATDLFGNVYHIEGKGKPFEMNLNPLNRVANTWLIAADMSARDRKADGFKLDALAVTTAPVPEPATWAMMIGGFALTGGALRRRRTTARCFTA